MRLMAIAAAALGGVLLLGMGGWALMGRKPATVPTIEADSRPLRVKPENAGGMQVAGAEEAVLGGQSAGTERMAPAPEAPAPQALRAQMQQSTAAVPAPAPVAALAPAAGPTAASPLPDTPARPMPAPRAASPARPTPVSAPVSGTLVQLAAVDSEDAAKAEWARLAKRMPDLLGERRPVMQRADRDGHAVWRIRTGGFADIADATGFCTKVRAKGGNCVLASG